MQVVQVIFTVTNVDSFNYFLPVDPSQTKASTVNVGKDTVLSSAVSGELLSFVTCVLVLVNQVTSLLCRPPRPFGTLQNVRKQKSC